MSDTGDLDVLLCYRGRYRQQVIALATQLRKAGLSVTYDVEILSDPNRTPLPDTDIVWFGTGDTPGSPQTAWRAPLHEAIGRAELSVFLYDAANPSENVWNEVAWVSRSRRNVFFVIDTGRGTTSDEHECIELGTLQSLYGIARETLTAEIPQFGYLFIAQDDPQALAGRLGVLGNRILAYLDQVRHHKLPLLRLDNALTLTDAQNLPLERARQRLRSIQRAVYALGFPAAKVSEFEALGDSIFRQSIDRLHDIENGASVTDGRLRTPDSPFRYPEASERRRFARTEAIAQRIRCGPFELPGYFTALARQAATIEMAVEDARWAYQPAAPGYAPAILFGTLPLSNSRSIPRLSTTADTAIILLNAAFIDLCYQTIKLCIASWGSSRESDGVGFETNAARTRQRLHEKPGILDTLANWLHGYCTLGYLQGQSVSPPAAEQVPLRLHTASAERFTLAHGYAALAQLDFQQPGAPPASRNEKFCDTIALRTVLDTALTFDRVDPTMAVQGCLIAMNTDELVRRALACFPNDGRFVIPEAAAPLDQRRAVARQAHRDALQAAGWNDADTEPALNLASEAADTVMLLWEMAEERFRARIAATAGAPCSMWLLPNPEH